VWCRLAPEASDHWGCVPAHTQGSRSALDRTHDVAGSSAASSISAKHGRIPNGTGGHISAAGETGITLELKGRVPAPPSIPPAQTHPGGTAASRIRQQESLAAGYSSRLRRLPSAVAALTEHQQRCQLPP